MIAAHLRQREYAKALAAIDALEKKQPQNPLPHGLRGNVLLEMNDVAGARKSFERALAITEAAYGPDHPTVAANLNNLGSIRQQAGDLDVFPHWVSLIPTRHGGKRISAAATR